MIFVLPGYFYRIPGVGSVRDVVKVSVYNIFILLSTNDDNYDKTVFKSEITNSR